MCYRNFKPESQNSWAPALALRSQPVSTAQYWTVYLFSAFQAERTEDCDGEVLGTKGVGTHPDSVFTGVSTEGRWTPEHTGICAVFVETLRDAYADVQSPLTVAHEIAHTLGVDHGVGLMDEQEQGESFSASSLLELRSYVQP